MPCLARVGGGAGRKDSACNAFVIDRGVKRIAVFTLINNKRKNSLRMMCACCVICDHRPQNRVMAHSVPFLDGMWKEGVVITHKAPSLYKLGALCMVG